MMLYEYVSFATGKAILQKNAIGFSQPKFFNDPFDQPAYPPEPTENPIDAMFAHVRTWGKNQIWSENTGSPVANPHADQPPHVGTLRR